MVVKTVAKDAIATSTNKREYGILTEFPDEFPLGSPLDPPEGVDGDPGEAEGVVPLQRLTEGVRTLQALGRAIACV